MLKMIILTLAAILFVSFSYAAEEQITITTYYPSPYGVYKELKLHPNTAPNTCNEDNEGAMYYDANADIAKRRPKVCTKTDTSYEWKDLGGGSNWTETTTETVNNLISTSNPQAFIQITNYDKEPFVCNVNRSGALYFDTTKQRVMVCNGAGGWGDLQGLIVDVGESDCNGRWCNTDTLTANKLCMMAGFARGRIEDEYSMIHGGHLHGFTSCPSSRWDGTHWVACVGGMDCGASNCDCKGCCSAEPYVCNCKRITKVECYEE